MLKRFIKFLFGTKETATPNVESSGVKVKTTVEPPHRNVKNNTPNAMEVKKKTFYASLVECDKESTAEKIENFKDALSNPLSFSCRELDEMFLELFHFKPSSKSTLKHPYKKKHQFTQLCLQELSKLEERWT